MNYDPTAISIVSMVLGGVISGTVVKVWFNGGSHKMETCMELLTQNLNNQGPILKQIHDDGRGTHSTVKNTHERVARIENVQGCQGKEQESMVRELGEIRQNLSK